MSVMRQTKGGTARPGRRQRRQRPAHPRDPADVPEALDGLIVEIAQLKSLFRQVPGLASIHAHVQMRAEPSAEGGGVSALGVARIDDYVVRPSIFQVLRSLLRATKAPLRVPIQTATLMTTRVTDGAGAVPACGGRANPQTRAQCGSSPEPWRGFFRDARSAWLALQERADGTDFSPRPGRSRSRARP